jgi:Transcriptional Coactivator p15 (PC4)
MNAALKLKADDSITFPLVIAEWDRNSREVIRVALDRYNGRHTVNCRIWYRDRDDDTLRPGKAGIALGVKHLPALADALGKALARAHQLGLLEDGGGQ